MANAIYCCDSCFTLNFNGRRYHCMKCPDFDLCRDCFHRHVEISEHKMEHAMELVIEAEPIDLMHLHNCYSCPYCGLMGHNAKELIDHVVNEHPREERHAVCPMCADLTDVQLVPIPDLARHLLQNHIEHANQLNPFTPPMQLSMSQTANSNTNFLNGNNSPRSGRSISSRMNSEDGMEAMFHQTELDEQLPEEAFHYYEDPTHNYRLENPQPEENPHPEENQSPNPNPNCDAPNMDNENEVNTSLEQPEPPAEEGQYLLQQWITDQQSHLDTLTNHQEREQHALFAEHLMLSMLCEEQLHPQQPQPQSQNNNGELTRNSLISIYLPSKIMMLMSMPWLRTYVIRGQPNFIKLQDESTVIDSIKDRKMQEVD